MRSKALAGILGFVMALSAAAPFPASASERAPLAQAGLAAGSPPTAAQPAGTWFERAWRQVLDAFGFSASGAGAWTDKDIDGAATCGSRGCACCHSSLMVPRNVGRDFVHPGPARPGEDINSLYLRAAKTIAKMEPQERDAVRKQIRSAIANSDEAAALRLIEAVVAKPPASKN